MNKGMKALKKESPEVAKKMGYMMCGMSKKKKDMMGVGMAYGGMSKKKTCYNKCGLCGADVPAARPIKKGK